MNIGIDVSETLGQKTGIGSYTTQLVEALAKLDTENRYTLYPVFFDNFPPTFKAARAPRQSNFRVYGRWLPRRLMIYLWHYSGLEKETIFGHRDIWHSTTFSAPKLRRGKLIVTIYDLSFLTHPECHREVNRRYCTEQVYLAAQRADCLIAISEATKRDLLDYVHVPEERVVVTPLAAGENFRPVAAEQRGEVLRRHQLWSDYIFSLGSLEPRKNLDLLLRAYARLPVALREEVRLVIAGAKGWKNSRIFALVQELGLERQVQFLGYVAEEDLPALYSGCRLFAYPSLYEGFGLPVLEALSCGAAVVTSNTSSLPEVAGQAALLLPPDNEELWTEVLAGLLQEPQLLNSLRAKALPRAAEFSWRRTAELTLDAYRAVHGQGAHS